MSPADCPANGLLGWSADDLALNATSASVEHVKTRCPMLIATLVAIAHAAKNDGPLDDEPGRTSPAAAGRLRAAPRRPSRSPRAPSHRQARGTA
jgi:hypothetical protein